MGVDVVTFAPPTVRNINSDPDWWSHPRGVYIGRNDGLARDCGMVAPIWVNPFRAPTHGTRDEVVDKYERWLDARANPEPGRVHAVQVGILLASMCPPGTVPELRESLYQMLPMGDDLRQALLALSGKELWCHCAPKNCHGWAIRRVFARTAGIDEVMP